MSKRRIEDILFECIEAIKAGKSDIDVCLKRYPSLREELESLLNIAISMREPPDIQPSHEFKVRARASLMQHIYLQQAATKSLQIAPVSKAKRMAYSFRLRALTVSLAIVACVCGLGGGLAYASQDSLPGDTLYPMKLTTEELRRVVTADDIDEVKLELAFANVRLGEMAAVVHRGYEELNTVIDGYGKNSVAALETAVNIKDTSELTNTLEIVASATSGHLEILDLIEDTAPEEARYGIQQAREMSFEFHVEALRYLAAENPVRAAEINLATIESRLGRAKTKAEENQIDEAEVALSQFQELSRLGEEISQTSKALGKDTAVIDELNARATSAHLEALGIIYGEVPESEKQAVEEAMETSVDAYSQAIQGLQEKGVLYDIPEQPPIPEDFPADVKERISKPKQNSSESGSGGSGSGSGGSGNGRR